MPDITMCRSATCPLREQCYRNEASGTVPSGYQSWFMHEPKHGPDGCAYFRENKR